MLILKLYYLYVFVLSFAFISGIYRYKFLDGPAKIFCSYLGISLLTEIIAYYFAYKYKSNFAVYSIFNIVELIFISIYFNYRISIFQKHGIGVWIAILAVIIGILNIVFWQPLKSLNTNYLFFEGFCIIGMCLFSFTRLLLKQDKIDILRNQHFWITTIILLYWTGTYLYWGIYEAFIGNIEKIIHICDIAFLSLNIICYAIIGTVYLLTPKMRLAYE